MKTDITRSGYDNLFLVGGHNWLKRITLRKSISAQACIAQCHSLADELDAIDKTNIDAVIAWENKLNELTGDPLLPIKKKTVKLKDDVKVESKLAVEPKDDKAA
jgi:hypothetical protein